jgi:hypothetical protein
MTAYPPWGVPPSLGRCTDEVVQRPGSHVSSLVFGFGRFLGRELLVKGITASSAAASRCNAPQISRPPA